MRTDRSFSKGIEASDDNETPTSKGQVRRARRSKSDRAHCAGRCRECQTAIKPADASRTIAASMWNVALKVFQPRRGATIGQSPAYRPWVTTNLLLSSHSQFDQLEGQIAAELKRCLAEQKSAVSLLAAHVRCSEPLADVPLAKSGTVGTAPVNFYRGRPTCPRLIQLA